MSTYGGTATPSDERKDPAFQLAPADGDGPDMEAVLYAYQRTMSDNQPFVDQCRLNYETRYAIWNGQSSDGKKHGREGGGKIDPTPWDGASDLRVYLVDQAINFKCARNGLALKKASMVAIPVNGNDIERANVVGNFMKWLTNTQVPDVDREQELLSNYLWEKGVALTGQFWQTKQEKTLKILDIDGMQKQFPQINVELVLNHPELEEHLKDVISQRFDCSRAKATRILKDLRKYRTTTVPTLAKEISRPIVRAFCLDRDVFVPSWATDLETAPYIWRVEYFTAEQLRSFAQSEEWDEDWVEQAILKCRGQMITSIPDSTLQPISRSFVYIDRKLMYTDLIGVVFGYQRLSDEDGVPGIYLTIFNPHLPADEKQQGYAKFGLLGYQHGEYPFVLHRREFLSRKFHDSRGLAEPGKSFQDQIKAHRDSRCDAASVAILPPLCYPLGRPPTRWGPGARIPERRPGEYHYADKPGEDANTDESESLLVKTFNEYAGIVNPNEDPTMANTMGQSETIKWLTGWSKVYRQIWKLYQQYGDDKVVFRVMGLQKAPPQVMQKGDPQEDFDFWLSYDALSMNTDAQTTKLENIAKICATADKYGQVDYSQLLQLMLESVDSSIAERIILPKEQASQQFVQQEQLALAKISAGIDQDIHPGDPAQLGLQVDQQYAQTPDVATRLQNDQAFAQRLQKRMKQYQFQLTQAKNAQIGRLGA
jgi:hypothetical protein